MYIEGLFNVISIFGAFTANCEVFLEGYEEWISIRVSSRCQSRIM